MATATIPILPSKTSDLDTDTQAILDHVISGQPLDPIVAQRVRDQAMKITQEIRARHGILDIGVPAIRELRNS